MAHLPRLCAAGSRACRGSPNLRDRCPALALLGERWLGLSRAALPAALAPRHVLARAARAARQAATSATARAAKPVVLFVDTFNDYFETENALAAVARAAGRRLPVHVARATSAAASRSAAAARCWPPACVDEARGASARAARRAAAARARRGIADRRPRAVVPADLARRVPRAGPRRRGRDGRGAALLFEEFLAARGRGRPVRPLLQRCRASAAAARPLPPEGLRRDDAGARRAAADPRRRAAS